MKKAPRWCLAYIAEPVLDLSGQGNVCRLAVPAGLVCRHQRALLSAISSTAWSVASAIARYRRDVLARALHR